MKLEETEAGGRWQIQVKGLRETDTGFFDLRDETGALVDKMLLKAGKGSYAREFERGGTSRGGRRFDRICGIRLELSGSRALEGRWKLAGEAGDLTGKRDAGTGTEGLTGKRDAGAGTGDLTGKGSSVQGLGEGQRIGKMEKDAGKEDGERRGEEENARLGEGTLKSSQEGGGGSGAVYRKKCMGRRMGSGEGMGRGDAEAAFSEGKGGEGKYIREERAVTAAELSAEEYADNKWDQLGRIYPTVHPFGDDREYLSIAPRDFVILGREYQKLVHNSFLLHGYYNYRHVILGRFGEEKDEKYYLGVPGVFHDREKLAAEMFGFEAFEGKSSPVEPGSFGYYMKRVQI